MLIAQLIVDPADGLCLILRLLSAKNDLATLIVRFRKACGQFQRDRTKQSRIHPIVQKWPTQGDRPSVACCGGIRRKVARKHRGCWNELPYVSGVLPKYRALIPSHEK